MQFSHPALVPGMATGLRSHPRCVCSLSRQTPARDLRSRRSHLRCICPFCDKAQHGGACDLLGRRSRPRCVCSFHGKLPRSATLSPGHGIFREPRLQPRWQGGPPPPQTEVTFEGWLDLVGQSEPCSRAGNTSTPDSGAG